MNMILPLKQHLENIKNGESDDVLFKTKLSQHVARNISAMANSNGGYIYFGVNDNGVIVGLSHEECQKYKTQIEEISKRINAKIDCFIYNPDVLKCILVIQVYKSAKIIYGTDGVAYERQFTQTIRKFHKNFNIVAVKILEDCDEIYCKNLLRKIYYFNNSGRLDNKGKFIINDNYNNIYPEGISISAIVGMNGSGKSALFEIIYRIINNFSCLIERDLKRNASQKLYFVKNLYADLYYFINEDLHCISCKGINVQLKRNNDVLLDLYLNQDNYPNSIYNTLKQLQLANFTQNLFYSIVTNYSIQALICTDFRDEPTSQVLKNGKSQEVDNLLWMASIFYKNDGYITPIVFNPFRDINGNIDIQNESTLTRNRLVSILYYYHLKGETFIDGYELNDIKYTYNYNYLLDKFVSSAYSSQDEIAEIQRKIWNFNEFIIKNPHSYSSAILEEFGYKDLIKKFQSNNIEICRACTYLIYKVLSIAEKYPSYERYDSIGKKLFFETNSEKDKLDLLKKLVKDIKKDKSHITLKVRQTIDWLDSISKKSSDEYLREFDLNTYYKTIRDGKIPNKISEIIETLPPPFFTPQITLRRKKTKNPLEQEFVSIERMSAGERQFIYTFSTIIYHICNILSIQDSKRIKYRNVNLIFDEVEICFHPEYQRVFVQKLISTLSNIGMTRFCSFNIMIATHSPFILSDIPQDNILYLENGQDVSDSINVSPFGANINDILRQSFFLQNGFIGEYAKNTIMNVVNYLTCRNGKSRWSKETLKRCIIDQIGDEIIREQLNLLFNSMLDNEKNINNR